MFLLCYVIVGKIAYVYCEGSVDIVYKKINSYVVFL